MNNWTLPLPGCSGSRFSRAVQTLPRSLRFRVYPKPGEIYKLLPVFWIYLGISYHVQKTSKRKHPDQTVCSKRGDFPHKDIEKGHLWNRCMRLWCCFQCVLMGLLKNWTNFFIRHNWKAWYYSLKVGIVIANVSFVLGRWTNNFS